MATNNPTSNSRIPHIAFYGNVKMLRVWCDDCTSYALVVKGIKQCCDKPCADEPEAYKRMCEPEAARYRPSRADQAIILAVQDHRCFYCDRMFGKSVISRRRSVRLRIEWDHLVPFSWSQNNETMNFVAACHICNQNKGAIMFQTVDAARIFLRAAFGAEPRPAFFNSAAPDNEVT